MLAIDTDAHSTDGLGEIGFGIDVARRAWVTREASSTACPRRN